jgi:predicted MarR family transcription regulator
MRQTKLSSGTKIVSSAHLVSEKSAELSELEFALIMTGNAFNRWVVRCMGAAGYRDLGTLDVLVLHTANHRDRAKKLADICLVLNVEDSHTVSYSLKKLAKLGFVQSEKRGKEQMYSTTLKGRSVCHDYRRVREDCLIGALDATNELNREIGQLAALLRGLSGLYDQAARAATSL